MQVVRATCFPFKRASALVGRTKFCESCDRNMRVSIPRPVSFEAATNAAAKFSASDIPAAAAALEPVTKEEEMAAMTIYQCPQCRNAYVEVTATFAAKFPRADNPRQQDQANDSWLVLSRALTAEQAASFLPLQTT